jgi:chromosome segregation ATPase
MKAEGVGVKQVINIIKIANNDLPPVEQKYQKLKREINFLESRKLEGYKTLGEIKDQIKGLEKMLGFLETSCQEVNTNIDKLEREEIRLKKTCKTF